MKRPLTTRFLLTSNALAPEISAQEQHLVCGAGGTRAIIGCAGAIFGLYAQGLRSWATIGGISGGSLPALLYAAGLHPRNLLRRSLSTNFATLIVKKRHILEVVRKYFLQPKHQRMPRTAVHCSKEMIKFIDELVPTWPDKFWTMAVADIPGKGRCQVFFDKTGVYVYTKEGDCEQIAIVPAPVGLAVAASCAIPGIIDHVEYLGLHLYDGMMSWDGRTPAQVVNRHYGAEYHNVVAVDVGAIQPAFPAVYKRIAASLCDDDCHPDTHMRPEDWEDLGVKVVRTNINVFGSLNLNPTPKQRSHAMRLGYKASIRALCRKSKVKLSTKTDSLLDSPLDKLNLGAFDKHTLSGPVDRASVKKRSRTKKSSKTSKKAKGKKS